jgi:small subunit ribosomal protein S9
VYLWAGEGRILVNKKPVDDYFRDLVWRSALLQPLLLTNTVGKVDIVVQVGGVRARWGLCVGTGLKA